MSAWQWVTLNNPLPLCTLQGCNLECDLHTSVAASLLAKKGGAFCAHVGHTHCTVLASIVRLGFFSSPTISWLPWLLPVFCSLPWFQLPWVLITVKCVVCVHVENTWRFYAVLRWFVIHNNLATSVPGSSLPGWTSVGLGELRMDCNNIVCCFWVPSTALVFLRLFIVWILLLIVRDHVSFITRQWITWSVYSLCKISILCIGLTPPMGWNTWCTLNKWVLPSDCGGIVSHHVIILNNSCGYDLCYASEIMSVADAMATNGMKELGYEYINLDGMWILTLLTHSLSVWIALQDKIKHLTLRLLGWLPWFSGQYCTRQVKISWVSAGRWCGFAVWR